MRRRHHVGTLKKRKYYKKHNIKPSVNPEQEFMITKSDILKIKQFLSGDRTMYLPFNNDLNKEICHKPSFPSKNFMEDKRVPKLKKDSKNQVPNMGMFVPDTNANEGYYEASMSNSNSNEIFDARDFTNSTSFSDVKFDPRNDSKIIRHLVHAKFQDNLEIDRTQMMFTKKIVVSYLIKVSMVQKEIQT